MNKSKAQMPIGIFDSGVGGLTVARAVMRELPHEHILYLGDTARVPYGTKSAATVRRYSLNTARFLVERGVKLLVVACNTASALALPELRDSLGIPVLGVVQPSARQAVRASRRGVIVVMGTQATVSSGAYQEAITQLDPGARVLAVPCPLLVGLAEEGWTEGEVPRQVVDRYLGPLAEAGGFDVVVLGCTHYPLLKKTIGETVRALVGPDVVLVDSADSVAVAAREELERLGLERTPDRGEAPPARHFYVTDCAEGFRQVGSRFLGSDLQCLELVELQ